MKKNIELIKRLKPLSFRLYEYCPAPGTELYRLNRKNLPKGKCNENAVPEPVPVLPMRVYRLRFKILKLRFYLVNGYRRRGIFFLADSATAFMRSLRFTIRSARFSEGILYAGIYSLTRFLIEMVTDVFLARE